MSASDLPVEGACRCGRLRIRISAPPLVTLACHCTGCQHMSASAFSLTVMVPAEGFEVIAGEAVLGGVQEPPVHHHCAHCKSWVFTRPTDAPIVNVRPTMLETTRWATPFVETFTSEKLPWATTPAVHSFERFPPMEKFGALIAAYRAHVEAQG